MTRSFHKPNGQRKIGISYAVGNAIRSDSPVVAAHIFPAAPALAVVLDLVHFLHIVRVLVRSSGLSADPTPVIYYASFLTTYPLVRLCVALCTLALHH
jgi:hypothetical protein